MTGDTHYDIEVLAELAEGLLDVATAARVREHLAVCDPCGESLADLAAVREVLAAVPMPAMPMGVALRIDKALAAEAQTRTAGGRTLGEAPDWDRIMVDSPWETQAPVPEVPFVEQPDRLVAPLGVVADDGTIVPAGRRRTLWRRAWAKPAAAGVAAAVVIGAAGLASTMLTASDTGERSPSVALPPPVVPSAKPSAQPQRATTGKAAAEQPGRGYMVSKSGFNYSNTVLNGPLVTYMGATTPISEGNAPVDAAVERCVAKVSKHVGRRLGQKKAVKPISVDRGFYEGNEATVMAFWKDRFRNAVFVYVVNSHCANVRPVAVSRWR